MASWEEEEQIDPTDIVYINPEVPFEIISFEYPHWRWESNTHSSKTQQLVSKLNEILFTK